MRMTSVMLIVIPLVLAALAFMTPVAAATLLDTNDTSVTGDNAGTESMMVRAVSYALESATTIDSKVSWARGDTYASVDLIANDTVESSSSPMDSGLPPAIATMTLDGNISVTGAIDGTEVRNPDGWTQFVDVARAMSLSNATKTVT